MNIFIKTQRAKVISAALLFDARRPIKLKIVPNKTNLFSFIENLDVKKNRIIPIA